MCKACQTKKEEARKNNVRTDVVPSHDEWLASYRSNGSSTVAVFIGLRSPKNSPGDSSPPVQAATP